MPALKGSVLFTVSDLQGRRKGAPEWFVSWIRLGVLLADKEMMAGSSDDQVVLAVSAPTRLMAAAAVAFGYAWRSFRLCPPSHPEAMPSDLEIGTQIWLRTAGDHGRVVVGAFFGFQKTTEGHAIRVGGRAFLTSKVHEVRRIPEWIDTDDGCWLLEDHPPSRFLKEMLPGSDAMSFMTSWNSDLVVVGSRSHLEREIAEFVGPGREPSELGALREIVRPFNSAEAIGWRSFVMSAHSEIPIWKGWPEPPRLVVLDGAYAVGKWLDECRSPLVVAVLDRAEPGLDGAVSVLLQSRAFGVPLQTRQLRWTQPEGCELLVFRSAL